MLGMPSACSNSPAIRVFLNPGGPTSTKAAAAHGPARQARRGWRRWQRRREGSLGVGQPIRSVWTDNGLKRDPGRSPPEGDAHRCRDSGRCRGTRSDFRQEQAHDAAAKDLPTELGAVTVEYVGGAELATSYPQIPVPMSTMSGSSRFWTPSGRFACGSSVMVAPIHGAGTLGALIRLPDGRLYGLSSNHVTGDCNHTEVGMYIMCPAGIDAAVDNLPPTAIGKHSRLTPINTGDPGQIRKQELDAAIFEITDEKIVTSWQGNMEFDTPMSVVPPSAHLKVKKVGRTSGLTSGKINGEVRTPIGISYKSTKNSSFAHYTGLWTVSSPSGEPFSEGGDSGALIVTADGRRHSDGCRHVQQSC